MKPFLFDEFNETSAAAWKQKIQVDLKGVDYNEALLWKTDEGITVKPFYTKEDSTHVSIDLPEKGFNICQAVFIDDETIASYLATDALKKGANALFFTAAKTFDYRLLLKNINLETTEIYFQFQFLSADFINELAEFTVSKNTYFFTDIIGNLAATGNWFSSLKEDHLQLEKAVKTVSNSIGVNAATYQNAGANITQQLAYALAHAHEYLNYFGKEVAPKIHFRFAVGSNYFFEIAKLRAFRILWGTLLKEYQTENTATTIFAQPSLRNKTLYDYNVNLLRTTSECMSAILGGANTISNISYDEIYHKSNEFGERISRNQLLILQQENGLENGQNFVNGTYYIENITQQLAEKALIIFKQIEKGGGFLKQLKEGVIQRKIQESAKKEQDKFDKKELVLVGTNSQENPSDKMENNLKIYPFLKQQKHKTLITPIFKKRISESLEKEKLEKEKKYGRKN